MTVRQHKPRIVPQKTNEINHLGEPCKYNPAICCQEGYCYRCQLAKQGIPIKSLGEEK